MLKLIRTAARRLPFHPKTALRVAALAGVSSVLWGAGGNPLPFVSAVQSISTAMSGPFATAASLIMIVVTAFAWWRSHGEIGHMGQGIMGIVVILGIILGANSFMVALFPAAVGALV